MRSHTVQIYSSERRYDEVENVVAAFLDVDHVFERFTVEVVVKSGVGDLVAEIVFTPMGPLQN